MIQDDGTSLIAEVSLVQPSDGNGKGFLGIVFEQPRVAGKFWGDRDEDMRLGRALVENSSDPITLCNADNTIRYISRSVEYVLGYDPEELVGVYVPSLIHQDDLETAASEAERIVEEPERKSIPVRFRHKNGS
jgi:PAS domain-containing protein